MSVSISQISVQDGNGLAEEGSELEGWALLHNDGDRPVTLDIDFLINSQPRGTASTFIDPGGDQWTSAPVGQLNAGDHEVSVVVAVDDGDTSLQVDGTMPFVVATQTSDAAPSWESREREREIDRVTREYSPADGASHFESDWAGRAILARYLAGDGDWDIHDEQWSEYMRAHEGLRQKLDHHARNVIASAAFGGGEETVPVDEEFPADIDNGEGIIGYQYLHGTNADAGGFQIHGWVRSESPQNDGDASDDSSERTVHYYLEYTWNDVIDPNPQYDTDVFKNGIAEAITFGGAQGYRLSITWLGAGVVTVGPGGEVLEIATAPDGGSQVNAYPLQ